MMFILHCLDDNSHCQLPDDKVIFDKSHPPKAGDKVKFYWKNSPVLSNGKVIIYTDDKRLIFKIWKEVTATSKVNSVSADKSYENIIKTDKRMPKPKRWSSDDEDSTPEKPAMKQVKRSKPTTKEPVGESGEKESQNFIKNKILSKNSQTKKVSDQKVLQNIENIAEKASPKGTSPTKEEYKQLLAQSRRQLLELRSKVAEATLAKDDTLDNSLELETSLDGSVVETNAGGPEVTSMVQENSKDKTYKRGPDDKGRALDTGDKAGSSKSITESDQLLGQFHGETMIHIGDNIFCTKKKYDQGRGSGDATTMARHMIDGIFKREAILRCTLTGQPPRAQGTEKRMEKVEALDFDAKEQIIECVLKEAKRKGWKKRVKKNDESREYEKSDIERTMTQRIGEIKREVSKNIELNKQQLNQTK